MVKKELLTAGTNGQTQKFFIMGNHGMLPNSKYYDTLKDCVIEIFRLCKTGKYENIYSLSDTRYKKEILGIGNNNF